MNGSRVISTDPGRIRRVGWRYLFGHDLDAAMSICNTTQWYPSQVISEIQWDQVCDIVAHAREVSDFYRARLLACDLGPGLTPEGFHRIPSLTRSDLVALRKGIGATALQTALMHRRSGGSSGESVAVSVDRATYCWYVAGTWRGLRWWGCDFSDRAVIILGTGGRLRRLAVGVKDRIMNWLRVPVDGRFDERGETLLDRMAAFGPAFLYGYPSAVHRLARAIKNRGWSPHGRLKVIALTGEPVYLFQRRAIEESFQCPVAEEYGSGELGNMAFQCPDGMLHIAAENVFLETAADPPATGEGGTILATHLHNRRFPLIRYETGDWGVVTTTPCRCGRGLPAVRVLGRVQERLGDQGAMRLRQRAEHFLNALPAHLQGRVQVVDGADKHIELRVERDHASPDDLARVGSLGAMIFGSEWTLDTVQVGRFVRLGSGKLPYFLRQDLHG